MTDGITYYSASDIGGCVRSQVASRLNYPKRPFDDATLTLFKEGHLHERAVIEEMIEAGWEIEYETEEKECLTHWETCRQIEVVLSVTRKLAVVAHLDGKALFNDTWCALEIKSMSDENFKDVFQNGWDGKVWMPKYKWQVSVQTLATGLPLYFRYKNRNNGQVEDLWVDKPFYTKAEIMARVLEVEAGVRSESLPACSPGSNTFFCPFDVCEIVRPVEVDDADLEQLGRDYKMAKVEADAASHKSTEAGKRVAEIRKLLKESCKGIDKVKVGKVRITWYWQTNGKGSVDKGKLEALGLKEEEYIVKGRSERLRVEIDE